MTVSIESPATLLDLAELAGARTLRDWDVVREMHRRGQTFAARLDGRLVGIAGFYPIEEAGAAEAWFNASPEAARHLLAIVRHFRLTAVAGPYREIVTVCASEAGRRIARAAGFTFRQDTQAGELWAWQAS